MYCSFIIRMSSMTLQGFKALHFLLLRIIHLEYAIQLLLNTSALRKWPLTLDQAGGSHCR